jgi:glycosyltransferase involved in cell wall biosynthesis
MKILWFTWKDLTHPLAGGAEVVNQELAKRLVKEGHEVTFVVGNYADGITEEIHSEGYRIIRLGSRFTIYWKAYNYYKKYLQGWADLVIDEVNTIPFFAKFYVDEPSVMFIHMLCRQIWFYELRQPLSSIGYLLEPFYLRLLSSQKVITVSESTRLDLVRVGFKSNAINIISEGTQAPKFSSLPPVSRKQIRPTLLSIGAVRPMKRTLDQLRAFEMAKYHLPDLRLWIAGSNDGSYGKKVLKAVKSSPYASDITCYGRVSESLKWKLMQECHFLLVTSVREGWGLIVTEANSQGTPALVYNVDGLRDSVHQNETGRITEHNSSLSMAHTILESFQDLNGYKVMRKKAWLWSNEITFDKSYARFKEIIGL